MALSKQTVWWIERDSIGLAEYDPRLERKDQFKSVTSAVTITLFYYAKADHFYTLDHASSSMSQVNDIPVQFHQYLVDRAIQLGYETQSEGIKLASYFEIKFEKGIKEGKMFANRGRVSGMRQIKQTHF